MPALHSIAGAIACAALASIAGTSPAAAGPAPPQLRNKTVTVTSTLQFSQRAPDGRFASPTLQSRYTIYISSAGRAFVRGTRSINNPHFSASKSADIAPGQRHSDGTETREMQFEGGKLVGTAGFVSGAARMVVGFDPAYATCTARIVFGKAGGAPIRIKGLDGVLYEIMSVNVSRSDCAIAAGNAFAG